MLTPNPLRDVPRSQTLEELSFETGLAPATVGRLLCPRGLKNVTLNSIEQFLDCMGYELVLTVRKKGGNREQAPLP